MRALSIKQPWAWLIVNGYKDIENRSWKTARRGEFLVHAGLAFDANADMGFIEDMVDVIREISPERPPLPSLEQFERGGIVGQSSIVDCVTNHESPWFFGPVDFVLTDSKVLPFRPCKGALSFFDPEKVR